MADILIFHMSTINGYLQKNKQVAAATAVIIGTGITAKIGKKLYAIHKKRQLRLKKSRQREESINKWIEHVNGDAVPEEIQKQILSLSVVELSKKIKAGEFTAKQALRAYQQQAILAHNVTNCIIEPIWEAEEWADELDRRKDKTGSLFGVPVSIKDNYGIKGYDSCAGCAKWVDDPWREDCVTVKVMKQEGAIPIVKTTVPQTMMSLETTSPIFGQTRNPFDPARISGGSSGGESALIALKGSPLGYGSDIGGSIRFPCHCCGIMGIKPTSKRTSGDGMRSATNGQNLIRPGYGPLAGDLDSLVAGFKVMVNEKVFQCDPNIPPVPFNEQLYQSRNKLKIAYFSDDGFFACSPACARSVTVAKEALHRSGHELVPFDITRFSEKAMFLYIKCAGADRGKSVQSCLENDIVDHAMAGQLSLYNLNPMVKTLAIFLLGVIGYKKMSNTLKQTTGFDNIPEWQDFVAEVEKFKKELREHMVSNDIDAILGPSFCIPAPTIGTWAKATGMGSYTFLFNVVDFPTGSLPVTKVTQEDQDAMKDFPVPDIWHKAAKKSSEQGTVGLPLNVTIATLPWKEELCLRIMKELNEQLKK